MFSRCIVRTSFPNPMPRTVKNANSKYMWNGALDLDELLAISFLLYILEFIHSLILYMVLPYLVQLYCWKDGIDDKLHKCQKESIVKIFESHK